MSYFSIERAGFPFGPTTINTCVVLFSTVVAGFGCGSDGRIVSEISTAAYLVGHALHHSCRVYPRLVSILLKYSPEYEQFQRTLLK